MSMRKRNVSYFVGFYFYFLKAININVKKRFLYQKKFYWVILILRYSCIAYDI